jgi:eukaryotic-like serine/threonine-protein kinase
MTAATWGRYESKQVLADVAHSIIHLGQDSDTGRAVLIRVFKDAENYARHRLDIHAASGLRHDNIVPIYEVGESGDQRFVVSAHIPGQTLAQVLAREGRLQPEQAAYWLSEVFDGLACAHRQNIVHGSLSPELIQIGEDGRARITDFGVAGLSAAPERYGAAPEAATRQAFIASDDLYAASAMLHEMLTGTRASANRPVAALKLSGAAAALSEIVRKALAPEPTKRFGSALEIAQSLRRFLETCGPEGDAATSPALDALMRRMCGKSDFPAMSSAISSISVMTSADNSNVSTLSDAILKDFALTNKLLRVVNSANYGQFSGPGTSTISRAVVILGVNTVRRIAIALALFDRIADKSYAENLKAEFLRANLTAMLARELCASTLGSNPEEAYICGLFHRLGYLLARFYFPDEADAVQRLVSEKKLDEEVAAERVLGISYQDFGIGVARSWALPEAIVNSMRRMPPGRVRKPAAGAKPSLQALSAFGSELCAIIETTGSNTREAAIDQLMKRYQDGLPVQRRSIDYATAAATESLTELAHAFDIELKTTDMGRQLAIVPAPVVDAPVPDAQALPSAEPAAPAVESIAVPSAAASSSVETRLGAGIAEIGLALAGGQPMRALLQQVADTIHSGAGLKRVVLCLRDVKTGRMQAQLAAGMPAELVRASFHFDMDGQTDLFNMILQREMDILISDSAEIKVRQHLPDWYLSHFSAPTFMLFPLRVKQRPIGMIYADSDAAGSIVISREALNLLRTLRDQAIQSITKRSAPEQRPAPVRPTSGSAALLAAFVK